MWLLHLSVADNLAGTLFSLPFALFYCLLWGASMLPAAVRSSSRFAATATSYILMATAIYVVGLMVEPSESNPLTPMLANRRLLALVILSLLLLFVSPLVAVFLARSRRFMDLPKYLQLLVFGGLFFVPLELAVWTDARITRFKIDSGRTSMVEVELPDKLVVIGRMVRPIEAGYLLKLDRGWVLIPKTEIKRVTELTAKTESSASHK
jgi:hypothetical protein